MAQIYHCPAPNKKVWGGGGAHGSLAHTHTHTHTRFLRQCPVKHFYNHLTSFTSKNWFFLLLLFLFVCLFVFVVVVGGGGGRSIKSGPPII